MTGFRIQRVRVTVRSDPVASLALLAVWSTLCPPERWPLIFAVGGAQFRLQELLFLAFLLAVALSPADRTQVRRTLAEPPIWLLTVFVAIVCVSLLRVPGPNLNEALTSAAKLFEFILVMILAGICIVRRDQARVLLLGLAVGALLNGVLSFGASWAKAGSVSGLIDLRQKGLLNPDVMSLVGTFVLLATMACVMDGTRTRIREIAFLIASGVTAMLAGRSLVAAGALVIGMVVVFALVHSRRAAAGVALSIILLACVISTRTYDLSEVTKLNPTQAASAKPPAGPDSPKSNAAPGQPAPLPAAGSVNHRLLLAYLGYLVARDHPLTGVGWLQSAKPRWFGSRAYQQKAHERFPTIDTRLLPSKTEATHSHEAYVEIAADSGIFAVLALLSALVVGFVRIALASQRSAGLDRAWAASLSAIIMAGGLWLNAVPPFGSVETGLVWLALGMAAATARFSTVPTAWAYEFPSRN